MLQGGGGYHLDSGWEGGRTRNVFAMASFYYSELLKLETEYGVFDLRTYVFFPTSFLPELSRSDVAFQRSYYSEKSIAI